MSKRPHSLDDFKKWMESQDEPPTTPVKEKVVEETAKVHSKISPRKLAVKMTADEGDEEELAEDFARNGGIVIESTEETLLIAVDAGQFYLPTKYVEI
jgi:hypothetical protein